MEGNTKRARFAAGLAALLVCAASHAQAPPNGPIDDILKRPSLLEREVTELQSAAGKGSVLVDATGRTVGRVVADSLEQAVVAVEVEGKEWAFAFSLYELPTWGLFFSRSYSTIDCSGPAYVRTAVFDGSLDSTLWGPGLFPFDSYDRQYKLPRVNAVPQQIYRLSIYTGSGRCLSLEGDGETINVYALDDLRVVDPFAGLVPPFKVVPTN